MFPGTHSFRHTADQVDVVPALTINNVSCNNVNTALDEIVAILNPVTQKATESVYGSIIFGGPGNDLDISNEGPGISKVIRIQGFPVSGATPTTNQVLAYNGSQWVPSSIGTFTANGDLSGSNTSQNVISLTGDTTTNVGYHTVKSSADYIEFIQSATPNITQAYAAKGSITAKNMVITAQSIPATGSPGGPGGEVIIGGGFGGGGGATLGGVSLSVGGSGNKIFQVTQINRSSPQTVAAFFPPPSGITTSQMPANTGSGVIYIGNTSTPPTASSPTGSILWSDSSGNLWVMPGTSANVGAFMVGSIPNPSTWGTLSATSGESITYRSVAVSSSSAAATVTFSPNPTFNLSQYTNTSIRVDCILVGKQVGSTNCAQHNLSMGFVVSSSGVVTPVGTTSSTDARVIGTWTNQSYTSPYVLNILSDGSGNLQIYTGYTASGSANWTVITQIVLSPQQ
jgi:hypothetical protein